VESAVSAPTLTRAAASLVGALLPALLGARSAHAEMPLLPMDTTRDKHDPIKVDSAHHFAVEVRFGPYSPKVDQSSAVPVFTDFFGDKQRFMLGLEIDWQAYRIPHLGPIGLGFSWGYTHFGAPNVEVGSLPPGGPANPLIAQQSGLGIMPFGQLAVLRVDVLSHDVGIPIVPYGKFGLSEALWWINNGLGTAHSAEGRSGKDISLGYQAAIGGMLLLDFLDPDSALALDADGGVANSYLFFEWSVSQYGGDQMNVGSSNWVTGFAIEL
jgi:hypothetical protein